MMFRLLSVLLLSLLLSLPVQARELRIVVATNFLATLQALSAEFEKNTGHTVTISAVSTGTAYTQLINGAPYDVWLTADEKTPEKFDLEDGLAVPGSRFTYAIGTLVLWSTKPGLVDDQGEVLGSNGWRHISVANPDVAPYGFGGHQVMRELGVLDKLLQERRIVQTTGVGPTHSQVASGAADLGFVALAQILQPDGSIPGSYWFPPTEMYTPIVQQALIVKSAREPELAQQFMDWLQHPDAVAVIKAAGYAVPE